MIVVGEGIEAGTKCNVTIMQHCIVSQCCVRCELDNIIFNVIYLKNIAA